MTLNTGKPALNAEYEDSDKETTAKFCPADEAAGITGSLFSVNLDGSYYSPCQAHGTLSMAPPEMVSTRSLSDLSRIQVKGFHPLHVRPRASPQAPPRGTPAPGSRIVDGADRRTDGRAPDRAGASGAT